MIETIHMKKTAKKTEQTERKLTDSPLNIWVKGLPSPLKTIFFERLYNNRLIWAPGLRIDQKKVLFNNYRYVDIARPNYQTKIFIYLTALSVNATLKIKKLFPEIEQEYIDHLLPILVEISLRTNHFNNAKNQKQQNKEASAIADYDGEQISNYG